MLNYSTIFRTITDEITGANKSIRLFGLSLKGVKDKLNVIKEKGLIESVFNSSVIDESIIKKYNFAIKSGTSAQEALAEASKNANQETIALMKSANGATVSTDALTVAQKSSTIAAKAGQVALKGLAFAGNLLVNVGIALALNTIVTGIDNLVNRVAKIKESAKEAKSTTFLCII